MIELYKKLRTYFFLIILLCAILLGALTGFWLGKDAVKLKPLGDIFLNLLFTIVIPLIFFSVSSAIASMGDLKRVGKVIAKMFLVFLFTSIIAGIFMIIVVIIFPPAHGVFIKLSTPTSTQNLNVAEQIVNIFTVSDFTKLFTRDNILALIVFSVIVGFATSVAGEKGKKVCELLQSGAAVSMKAVSFVMYYAPIGFFAYFAVLVADLGPKLLETYLRTIVIYYSAALLYFVVAFSFYAYLAAKNNGIKIFWKKAFLPVVTSLATCSSVASLPANLQSTKQIGVPAEIYETVVPLGTILHKDGSVLGGVVKIAFLFGIFHMSFASPMVLFIALLISLLVGTVIGAIPSGGMVAEILILSLYGFPPSTLIIIAAITLLIDPPATMLNVMGNNVSSMLVARLIAGRNWIVRDSV